MVAFMLMLLSSAIAARTISPMCATIEAIYSAATPEGSCCAGALRAGNITCDDTIVTHNMAKLSEDFQLLSGSVQSLQGSGRNTDKYASLPTLYALTHNGRLAYNVDSLQYNRYPVFSHTILAEYEFSVNLPISHRFDKSGKVIRTARGLVQYDVMMGASEMNGAETLFKELLSAMFSELEKAKLPLISPDIELCNSNAPAPFLFTLNDMNELVEYSDCIDDAWFYTSHNMYSSVDDNDIRKLYVLELGEMYFRLILNDFGAATEVQIGTISFGKMLVTRVPVVSALNATNLSFALIDYTSSTLKLRLRNWVRGYVASNNSTQIVDTFEIDLTSVKREAGQLRRHPWLASADAFVQKGTMRLRHSSAEYTCPERYESGGVFFEYTGVVFRRYFHGSRNGLNMRVLALDGTGFNAFAQEHHPFSGAGFNPLNKRKVHNRGSWTTSGIFKTQFQLDVARGVPTVYCTKIQPVTVALHEAIHAVQQTNLWSSHRIKNADPNLIETEQSVEGQAVFLERHPRLSQGCIATFRAGLVTRMIAKTTNGQPFLPIGGEVLKRADGNDVLAYGFVIFYEYFSRFDEDHDMSFIRNVMEIQEERNERIAVVTKDGVPNSYEIFENDPVGSSRKVFNEALRRMGQYYLDGRNGWARNFIIAAHCLQRMSTLSDEFKMFGFPDYAIDIYETLDGITLKNTFGDASPKVLIDSVRTVHNFHEARSLTMREGGSVWTYPSEYLSAKMQTAQHLITTSNSDVFQSLRGGTEFSYGTNTSRITWHPSGSFAFRQTGRTLWRLACLGSSDAEVVFIGQGRAKQVGSNTLYCDTNAQHFRVPMEYGDSMVIVFNHDLQYRSSTVPNHVLLIYDVGSAFYMIWNGEAASYVPGTFEQKGHLTDQLVERAGTVVCVVDSQTGSMSHGCAQEDYSLDVTGKIVLVQRGSCSFTKKQQIAQGLGAGAVFVINFDESLSDLQNSYYFESKIPIYLLKLSTGSEWIQRPPYVELRQMYPLSSGPDISSHYIQNKVHTIGNQTMTVGVSANMVA